MLPTPIRETVSVSLSDLVPTADLTLISGDKPIVIDVGGKYHSQRINSVNEAERQQTAKYSVHGVALEITATGPFTCFGVHAASANAAVELVDNIMANVDPKQEKDANGMLKPLNAVCLFERDTYSCEGCIDFGSFSQLRTSPLFTFAPPLRIESSLAADGSLSGPSLFFVLRNSGLQQYSSQDEAAANGVRVIINASISVAPNWEMKKTGGAWLAPLTWNEGVTGHLAPLPTPTQALADLAPKRNKAVALKSKKEVRKASGKLKHQKSLKVSKGASKGKGGGSKKVSKKGSRLSLKNNDKAKREKREAFEKVAKQNIQKKLGSDAKGTFKVKPSPEERKKYHLEKDNYEVTM